ncbi:MAG: Ppx/GppA family phosphatase [Limisphaerales bacterium]
MKPVRRAVIDVGTNSVKLLVAEADGPVIHPVIEQSRQTRLGKNFYESRRLQSDAIAQTAKAVAEFAELARRQNADSIRVVATSAARDAINPEDLVSAIARVCQLKLEIISGAQEAHWTFQGATTGTDLGRTPLLLVDVGGGSSEFILGHAGCESFARSFPLGVVRLLEKSIPGDPPSLDDFARCRDRVEAILRNDVHPALDPLLRREKQSGPVQLAGTGGTASILACLELKSSRFDREQIEATRLTLPKIRSFVETLWGLPLAKRKEMPGLPKSRADVILPGVLIFALLMETFGFEELRVSTRGLRFAAIFAPEQPAPGAR